MKKDTKLVLKTIQIISLIGVSAFCVFLFLNVVRLSNSLDLNGYLNMIKNMLHLVITLLLIIFIFICSRVIKWKTNKGDKNESN